MALGTRIRVKFDASKIFFGDIREFDLALAEGTDIVAGGPPCQPFSLGGKHGADKDDRDMFPYAIRTIERIRPKAFVFENVKGLLRASFADYFDYILCRLANPLTKQQTDEAWQAHHQRLKGVNSNGAANTRYRVSWQLLNAADYGVPQCRERVVIVGIRDDLQLDWQFPMASHSEDRLLWEQYVTKTYWKRHQLAGCQLPTAEQQQAFAISPCLKPSAFKPSRTTSQSRVLGEKPCGRSAMQCQCALAK